MKKVMVIVMKKNNIPTCYTAIGKKESLEAINYISIHAHSRIQPMRRVKRIATVKKAFKTTANGFCAVARGVAFTAKRIRYIASAVKTAFSKEFKKQDIDRRQDTSVSGFNCKHVFYP